MLEAIRHGKARTYTWSSSFFGRMSPARSLLKHWRNEPKPAFRFASSTTPSARWGLHRSLLRQLENAGGMVSAFLTLLNPLRRRIQINLRNHRKILVIDGRIGFTGGLNIGDEYLGKAPFFGPWRDTFMRLEGPAVSWMQRIFTEDWHFATEEEIVGSQYHPPTEAVGSVPAQIAWSGPDQEIKMIREIYFAAIMKAKHRLWIASPYFVPDTGLLDTCSVWRHVRGLTCGC